MGTTTTAVTTEATTTTSAPISDPARRRAAGEQIAGLYEAHARRVRLVCLQLLRDPHEADDALQQAFLSAYRALLRGGAPEDGGAWLVAIARNECRARVRDRMKTPLAEVEMDELPSRGDPVDEAALRAQLAAVLGAIGELPQRERDAIVLQAFGGVSNADVAWRLGTTESAVESLLVRARAQLRARVSPVATTARALLLAPPAWLRALLSPGGGDVVAVTKMGAAVAVVGTVVVLGQATPTGGHLALGGPAVADASSPIAPVARVQDARAPRFTAPRLGGQVEAVAPYARADRVRATPPRGAPSKRAPQPAEPTSGDDEGATVAPAETPTAAVDRSGETDHAGDDTVETTDESGGKGPDDGSSGESSGFDSGAADGEEGSGSSGPGGGAEASDATGSSEREGPGGATQEISGGGADGSGSSSGQSGSGDGGSSGGQSGSDAGDSGNSGHTD